MIPITTDEIKYIVKEFSYMYHPTIVHVEKGGSTKYHGNVTTIYDEGYKHHLNMYTLTRKVLAHELAHMVLRFIGEYDGYDQHGVQHTELTETILTKINNKLKN